MKYIYTITATAFLLSCNSSPRQDHQLISSGNIKAVQPGGSPSVIARAFRLNPAVNATYRYAITNLSEFTMEMNGNEMKTINNAEAIIAYTVKKDSTGNYLFSIRYGKIKIHTQKGDTETNADADNAALSANPVEKMLGMLKDADITAKVDVNGDIKDIRGYKELGDRLTSGFAAGDTYARDAARSQWEKLTGGDIFKGGIDKLFTVLPDSTVRPGDHWYSSSKQGGELPVNIRSVFTLKSITDDAAVITSSGEITGADGSAAMTGDENIRGDLKGKQKGRIMLDMKTGMVISNETSAKIDGTIEAMGVQVPVSIRSEVKIHELR